MSAKAKFKTCTFAKKLCRSDTKFIFTVFDHARELELHISGCFMSVRKFLFFRIFLRKVPGTFRGIQIQNLKKLKFLKIHFFWKFSKIFENFIFFRFLNSAELSWNFPQKNSKKTKNYAWSWNAPKYEVLTCSHGRKRWKWILWPNDTIFLQTYIAYADMLRSSDLEGKRKKENKLRNHSAKCEMWSNQEMYRNQDRKSDTVVSRDRSRRHTKAAEVLSKSEFSDVRRGPGSLGHIPAPPRTFLDCALIIIQKRLDFEPLFLQRKRAGI